MVSEIFVFNKIDFSETKVSVASDNTAEINVQKPIATAIFGDWSKALFPVRRPVDKDMPITTINKDEADHQGPIFV